MPFPPPACEAHTRVDCPVCGGRDLLSSVTLEALPVLCSTLHVDAESSFGAEVGRFSTTFCRSCSHVFNATFEEDRVGYTQRYDSSLEFSPHFVAFEQALVQRLNGTYVLKGKTIIDIGCGKGGFLRRLCAMSGANGIGFDKSFEMTRCETIAGVRFVNDWFQNTYTDVKPDFVSCLHVIEHIAEPVPFLRALRAHPAIRPETVFYFEVPNALYTLRDLGIWDLIYDHVSYFTPLSLRTAFEATGFDVLDAGTAFGDQYLYIEARPGAGGPPRLSAENGEIESLVRDFDNAYRGKIKRWRHYLAARDPGRIVVWGAGSKGVTFVNVVPGAERIGALVDVNPHKHSRFAPRTGTPIRAPEALRGQPVESVIIMNPLYQDEIARTVAALGLTPEIVVA
ncbi:MAG: class I SAM-dependent methyltransferase [Verrucomicrobiales bacterium]|nr:class I SAM-dependent methyltransferase [Verrucomicrobiales bacterium]